MDSKLLPQSNSLPSMSSAVFRISTFFEEAEDQVSREDVHSEASEKHPEETVAKDAPGEEVNDDEDDETEEDTDQGEEVAEEENNKDAARTVEATMTFIEDPTHGQ